MWGYRTGNLTNSHQITVDVFSYIWGNAFSFCLSLMKGSVLHFKPDISNSFYCLP